MDSELFSQALNQHAGFHVVACATSVSDVLLSVRKTAVDIALISTALEDGALSGIMAMQKLQETCPSVKGVILFERAEAHLIVSAFRAGARGVLCPTRDGIEKLCRCVDRVNDGQIWASSTELLQVLEAFAQSAPPRIVNAKGARLLTKREEQVVRLVEQALTNRQIAERLHLSEHTIRNNLFRIFDKLGVSTRVELALYAATASKRVLPPALDDSDTRANTRPHLFDEHSSDQ